MKAVQYAHLNGISAAALTAHLSSTPAGPGVTPVTARFWRLYMNDALGSAGGNTLSLNEITLFDATDSPISKSGAYVTASSTWGGGEVGASAYDGNLNTHWAGPRNSSTDNSWIQIDAGANISVAGFGVYYRDEYGSRPMRLRLEYTSGGSAPWNRFSADVFIKSPTPVPNILYRFSRLRRMYRVSILATHQGSQAGFQEIQFREVAGVPQTPTGGRAWASGEWGESESADKAFDGDPSTDWGRGIMPADIGYIFPNRFIAVEAMLQARSGSNASSAPSSFTIEYSDDIGLTWQTVYSSSSEPAWSSLEQRTYPLTNPS